MTTAHATAVDAFMTKYAALDDSEKQMVRAMIELRTSDELRVSRQLLAERLAASVPFRLT